MSWCRSLSWLSPRFRVLIISYISDTIEGQWLTKKNTEDWCRIIFEKLGGQVVFLTENKCCCSQLVVSDGYYVTGDW